MTSTSAMTLEEKFKALMKDFKATTVSNVELKNDTKQLEKQNEFL